MKFLSALLTSASGSVGGMTAANNKGGMYLRAKGQVVNPNTASQITVRQNLAGLTAAWGLDLDDAEQTSWNTYAQNVTYVDSLGSVKKKSGQNWFVGCNTLRKQAGLDELLLAPGIYSRATGTVPDITTTVGGTTVSVAFTNTDEWATADGGAMLVFASRPQNAGRSFFKGPFRLAGVVLGADPTAPTSPAVITLPYVTGPAGSKQFFRVVWLTADGRYSDGVIITTVAP